MIVTIPAKARGCMSAALVVVLVATAWTAFGRPAEGQAVGEPGHDRQSLLALLEAAEYERLNAHFVGLQGRYESGEIPESELQNAIAAFASSDPDLETRLTSWVERHPQSFAARLARGEFYRHLGRIGVPDGTSHRPPTEARGTANGYLALARQDVEAATERHPRLGVAYAALVNVAMAEGKGLEADRWFALGVAAAPRSVSLRRAYLLSLRPWRRPDQDPVELMASLDALVEDLREADEASPDLAALAGFHDYITAELLRRQRRYSQASRHYREALAQGRDWVYLRGAGINALQSAKKIAAVGFFSDALSLRPQDPQLLESRAHALWALGSHETALSDWRLALATDPGNPHILYGYAQALRSLGRAEAAAQAIAGAAAFALNSPKIRSLRGQMLLSELGRPREAVPELRAALELDPHAGDSWRAYAEALYRSNDCERAASAIVTYQRLCSNGTRCAEDDLNWARDALSGTRDPEICPVHGILGP
jgi:tetratricopeptide (TPR) repeat protein